MKLFILTYTKTVDHIWRQINAVASKPFLSILLVGFFSFAGSWSVSRVIGQRIPVVMDEFSYLLAADTFSHGRITNPTPALWKHFEAYHELLKPTYMSKFPPGQGAFLALGKVLFGHPLFGVWLSDGLMCSAICWMLYAWVVPRWALIGGLVAVIEFGVFNYWSQSYWGGAVTAMGGALVLGAIPRILKRQRLRDTLWLGTGIAVILNTRPLDGILLGVPMGCLLLPWCSRPRKIIWKDLIRKNLLPLAVIVTVIIAGIGWYNKEITGDARVFPHRLYDNQYFSIPVFIWGKESPAPPFLTNKELKTFNIARISYFRDKRTPQGLCHDLIHNAQVLDFYLPFPLATGTVFGLIFLFGRGQRFFCFMAAVLVFFAGCLSIPYPAKPHYFSWGTCLFVFITTLGLKIIFGFKLSKNRVGPLLVLLLIILQLAANIFSMAPSFSHPSLAKSADASSKGLPPSFSREYLRNYLIKKGGKHLVLVKYKISFLNIYEDWVYNDADIDSSPIVWARDLGEENNEKLFSHFKDRRVWTIEVYQELVPDMTPNGMNKL